MNIDKDISKLKGDFLKPRIAVNKNKVVI